MHVFANCPQARKAGREILIAPADFTPAVTAGPGAVLSGLICHVLAASCFSSPSPGLRFE